MLEEKLIIKSKGLKGEDGYKSFSIRVKEDIIIQLDSISQETGRSRNELIGLMLAYALGHYEIKKGD